MSFSRDRLFAEHFVRYLYIRFTCIYPFIILFISAEEYVLKALRYKYGPARSFNSVRLLSEIEMVGGLISSVDFERGYRIAIGKLHRDVCGMHPTTNESPTQSALMSVSSGKVNALKSGFNLSRRRSSFLPSSRFLFSERARWSYFLRESGVPSKFVQIYLLTFLQNIYYSAANEENFVSLIVYCFIFNVNREKHICCNRVEIYLLFAIRGAVKLAENGYNYSSQNTRPVFSDNDICNIYFFVQYTP